MELCTLPRFNTDDGIFGMVIPGRGLPLTILKGCYEHATVRSLDDPLTLDAAGIEAMIFLGVFSTCFDEIVWVIHSRALFLHPCRANFVVGGLL